MTNRQKKAQETRARIVAAAKRVIGEKGFDQVSVEDIAKEAGVATGSFYTYFKRKEDVVEELNHTDFFRLAERANEMENAALMERLGFYCREFLKAIEGSGIEVCRQWIRNNLSPELMDIRGESITKYRYDHRAMCSILSEAVQRGELKEDTPVEELSLYFNAELYGLMIAWCMSDAEVVGSKETDAFCEQVIHAAIKPYQR